MPLPLEITKTSQRMAFEAFMLGAGISSLVTSAIWLLLLGLFEK
jgi:hypothetical protein